MKKFMTLLLACMLILSLGSTAFAAPANVTISTKDNHTYMAYQIFTGDLAEDVLSNIKWGSDAWNDGKTVNTGDPVPEEVLKALDAVKDGTSEEKLAVINQYLKEGAEGVQVTKAQAASVAPGYYLIKDITDLEGQDDAKSNYIVKIAKDVVISAKTVKPTVDKQVQEKNQGGVSSFGETADHDINESFQFKLIATIPNDTDLDAYKTYKLIFTDNMSAGVTFDSIASVKLIKDGTSYDISAYDCTAAAPQAGGDWTLTIADLKKVSDGSDGFVDIKGTTVEVIYNAHLNEKAVVGNNDDNNNKVDLQYSNDAYSQGLGKTGPDTVWVFTYNLPNIKYGQERGSQEKTALKDAGFRLYSDAECQNEIKLALVDGCYYPGTAGVEMKSGVDGRFEIRGLDAGTYYLKETTTPAGYNTCEVIKIEITAVTKEDTATSASSTITLKINDQVASQNEIINKKGIVLPETGGMGTTLFYVIGGLLVATAVILLISKKRMSSKG